VEIKKAVKRGLILIGTFFGTCKIKLLMHNPIHITAVSGSQTFWLLGPHHHHHHQHSKTTLLVSVGSHSNSWMLNGWMYMTFQIACDLLEKVLNRFLPNKMFNIYWLYKCQWRFVHFHDFSKFRNQF